MSRPLMLVGLAVVTFMLAFLWWWQSGSEGVDAVSESATSQHELRPQTTRETPTIDRQSGSGTDVQSTASFELADLSDAQVGETVSFFLPQENRDIRLVVSESRQTPAGNRTLIAENLNEGVYHRLILTMGQFQSFGNIQTDRDRYQFAIANGTGDIHSVSAMNRRLDGSASDFVIRTPEQELPPEPIAPEKIEVYR